MAARFELEGKVAVVTGAAGGIGRAVAHSLAARGCHLALADIDADGLARTAADARVRVTRHRLDVGDAADVAAFPAEAVAAHGTVDVLVNNAGVALGGAFEQLDEADFDWLMAINLHGPIRMTRAFLPLLRARPQAQLVNVSSLFGLIAPPGQTAYCAAKFGLRGFSESLRNELLAERSGVGVTLVHPGGIRTGIAANARLSARMSDRQRRALQGRFERALRMPPERAGEIIVAGIARRAPRVLIGNDARLLSLVERIMPVGHWRLLGRIA